MKALSFFRRWSKTGVILDEPVAEQVNGASNKVEEETPAYAPDMPFEAESSVEAAKFINCEISWLSFNARVLQEAADPAVPLFERMKFLGIFSSNLDEFFRVRVATVKRMLGVGKKAIAILGDDPQKILTAIQAIVLRQKDEFEHIYQAILQELGRQHIFIINENQLTPEQIEFVKSYFHHEVRPKLAPIMIDSLPSTPSLKDKSIYLAVSMSRRADPVKKRYAIIEVPTDVLPRFLVLPEARSNRYVILLDDVIRNGLEDIFAILNFDQFEAYTIKLTRDAELDIEYDLSESFMKKISQSVKQREKGRPVRFIYDEEMPPDLLKLLLKRLHLTMDENVLSGSRYHNFKDFMKFPAIGLPAAQYHPQPPLTHVNIHQHKSLLRIIRAKDLILHHPYQTFHYLIDLLREAAIDPKVTSIKMTLYRMARHSTVVNALINAVKNGKAVTVIVELQARFDEEANIYWAGKLQEEGAQVIYGIPGLKVHAKLCLITREEKGKLVHYANLGTGNYNEETAKVYSDHRFFTADRRITNEVKQIFTFLEKNYKTGSYQHLVVSPFYMRKKFSKLVDNEIKNAKHGKPAYLILKLNSLVEQKMIRKLYHASKAGVQIKLIVRGICSLIAGQPGLSENIEALSIVDRYLEHSRIFVFANGGNEKYYLSSADWMQRNLDHRVEVAWPIYDSEVQQELRMFLDFQLRDNVKARLLYPPGNFYRHTPDPGSVRAQAAIYHYLKTQDAS